MRRLSFIVGPDVTLQRHLARFPSAVTGGLLDETLRRVLDWAVCTCASWRDLLLEFGRWETAYTRYRLWQANGLWQPLLTMLDDDAQSEA